MTDGMKRCQVCEKTLPLGDFMRRLGQPYFVGPDGRAWAMEPLLPQVEMAECCVCFGSQIIKEGQVEAGQE